MYIIDKLELIQQTHNIQTIEYVLSRYLLSNLSTIEKKNLKEISENHDLQILDTMILDFLKECEQAVSLQIDRICEKIKSSQRIMFYGQKDFINCFQYFVSYCHFNQKEVITSMSLSKENQKELFDSLSLCSSR